MARALTVNDSRCVWSWLLDSVGGLGLVSERWTYQMLSELHGGNGFLWEMVFGWRVEG